VQKLLKGGSSKIRAYRAEVRFLCGVTLNSPFLVTLFERMQQIKNPDVIWVFCVKAYGVAENGASVPPRGIEPRLQDPQSCVLSVERRGQCLVILLKAEELFNRVEECRLMLNFFEDRLQIGAKGIHFFMRHKNFESRLYARPEIEEHFVPFIIQCFNAPTFELSVGVEFKIVDRDAGIVDVKIDEARRAVAPYDEEDFGNDDEETKKKIMEPYGKRNDGSRDNDRYPIPGNILLAIFEFRCIPCDFEFWHGFILP
jgi:hypothetical protein